MDLTFLYFPYDSLTQISEDARIIDGTSPEAMQRVRECVMAL